MPAFPGAAAPSTQIAWNIYRDRITFPNMTSVKIPALAVYTDNPTEAVVEADGRDMGRTATVTDVDATGTGITPHPVGNAKPPSALSTHA